MAPFATINISYLSQDDLSVPGNSLTCTVTLAFVCLPSDSEVEELKFIEVDLTPHGSAAVKFQSLLVLFGTWNVMHGRVTGSETGSFPFFTCLFSLRCEVHEQIKSESGAR